MSYRLILSISICSFVILSASPSNVAANEAPKECTPVTSAEPEQKVATQIAKQAEAPTSAVGGPSTYVPPSRQSTRMRTYGATRGHNPAPPIGD